MSEIRISRMITKLRVAFGLTQEQFAAKVGVTLSTVNRWENGLGKPSPLAMARIRNYRTNWSGINNLNDIAELVYRAVYSRPPYWIIWPLLNTSS